MTTVAEVPELCTRRALVEKMGLSHTDAARMFQRCTHYQIPGSRRVYVRAEDVRAELAAYPVGAVR